MFRPETGKPLYELAQVLLRGESPLTEAERELIAAYVSNRNDTMFCMMSHAAAARHLYGDDKNIVDDVLKDMPNPQVRIKKSEVDGLTRFKTKNKKEYEAMGKRMAENGYTFPEQPK
jgi:AhpD family alkylhydroperoxidase